MINVVSHKNYSQLMLFKIIVLNNVSRDRITRSLCMYMEYMLISFTVLKESFV